MFGMKRTKARTKQAELDDTGRDGPESHTILGKINWSGIGGLNWTTSLSAFRMFSKRRQLKCAVFENHPPRTNLC